MLKLDSYFAPFTLCVFLGLLLIPSGISYSLYFVFFSCALLFLTNSFVPRKFATKEKWLLGFLAIHLLSTLASIFVSVDTERSILLSVSLIPSAAGFLIAGFFITTPKQIITIFGFLAVLSWVISAQAIYAFYLTAGAPIAQTAEAMKNPLVIVPNDLLFLALIVPLALASSSIAKKPLKLLALLGSALAAIAMVLLESRAALAILLLACLLFYFPTRLASLKTLGLLFLPFLALVVIDSLNGFLFIEKVFDNRGLIHRTIVWQTALEMFLDKPWFGQGPYVFETLYVDYLTRLNYSLDELYDVRIMPWAHNLYFELLAERGIFGLVSWLGIIATATVLLIDIIYSDNDSAITLAKGIAISLFCFLMAAYIELSFIRLWVSILFFLLLGFILNLWHSCQSESD